MKRLALITLVLFAAFSLFAQSTSQTPPAQPPAGQTPEKTEAAPPAPAFVPNLFGSFFSAGLQASNEDAGRSSKFEEYRDVPSGLTGPAFRIFSDTNGNPLLISGENIAQNDRRFSVWADTPAVRVDLLYDQIPHRLGNNAKSPEKIVSRDALGISDYIQGALQNALQQQFNTNKNAIAFPFLRSIVEPLINTPEVFDLGFDRKRAFLNVGLFPDAKVDTTISYFQENRSGTRSAGTSFGFGNVVETPEPVDYRTREAGVRMEVPLDNLMLRGSLSINQFANTYSSYTFDNPFRVTDSTDPSAYTGPASGSIGGAAMGRLALPPDNSRVSAAIGGIYKMPMHSRLTADLAFGQLRSNGELMPYTTNTAIQATVSEANVLPVDRFNGKINTTSANVTFTTRPLANLNITARYRYYDNDNNSPRIEFPGYVRFDAVWEDIPRITVPYSWKNNRAEVLASYDIGTGYSVEAGFRNDRTNRTYREANRTTENIAHIALDARPATWVTWRNSLEFGDRSFDGYNAARAEDATFVEPEPAVNPEGLRRFDVAERSSQRVISILSVNPFNGPFDATLDFTRNFDNYSKHAELGLLKWRNQTLTAEADYSPSERWSTFAFYSREYWDGFQRGRQSGATPSTNPLDNWTADNSDKANSFGAGFTVGIVPDKVDFNFTGRVQNVAGYANLDSPPGGSPDVAFDVPNVDDTRLWTLLAQVNYKVSTPWTVAFGAWYERYKINDLLNTGTQQYLPGGFFLAPNDLGYRGGAAYVSSTYRW
ncbi:MAG TPA: MtrB/PioB family outer membrane beta-barrel protein [Thermoanaerobaculia bacterium]|nr:MtrB/PioB family outer membrane beta-barrel protein [Thermoanaerobaculia bacterium]